MKSVAFIQARTTSSRLPGKVLLPLNGIPVVVLAAKRAANQGHKVIVATSVNNSDDALTQILENHGIPYARGSLDNTLDRCTSALQSFADDTIVFRLTADNVFPDGILLSELEEEFTTGNLSYLCCNGMPSGLPYGVSVELTRLKYIRQAAANTTDPIDREHVTPQIKRRFGVAYFEKYKHLNTGHLRCTIDCLDDYLSVQSVLAGFDDPINVSFLELVRELGRAASQPLINQKAPKLVLGGAQLGTQYGVVNRSGQPAAGEAKKIIKMAITNGAERLDTARVYGSSENIIGDVLSEGWEGRAKVVTKLAPLEELSDDASTSEVAAHVDKSIYQSCTALRQRSLDAVLLHRASHIIGWDGAVWERLKHHKSTGLISALGTSIQTPSELKAALDNEDIEHIQMPFNIIDHRWRPLIPHLEAAKCDRKITIDVRSVFLQGLLLVDKFDAWRAAGIENAGELTQWMDQLVISYRCDNRLNLCLGFVRDQEWVDGIVLGVERVEQLQQNIIGLANGKRFSKYELEAIENTRPIVNASSLNPSTWAVKHG